MQTDYQDEPKIVGFESKPVPKANTNEMKMFALIGVGILFAIFIFCMPTIDVASPHENQKKYVAPRTKGTTHRTAQEAIQEVKNNVDREMKKNQRMVDSIMNRP